MFHATTILLSTYDPAKYQKNMNILQNFFVYSNFPLQWRKHLILEQ